MVAPIGKAQNITRRKRVKQAEAEKWLKLFAENWAHIRHIEHYRMWGVNIYAVVVAGMASLLASGKAGPYYDCAAAFLVLFTLFNFLVTIKIELVIANFAQANELIRTRLGVGRKMAPVRTRGSGLAKYVRFAWLFPVFYLITLTGIVVLLLDFH